MEDENTNDTRAWILARLEPIEEEPIVEDSNISSMVNLEALTPATPMSIIPGTSEDWRSFSAAPPSPERLRPNDALVASLGGVALSGNNLKPHIIHIYPGQDVVEKIMSLCKEGHRVAIVLSVSAGATISSATLRGSNAANDVVLEGRFGITSLTGWFIASDCESASEDGVEGGLHLTASMALHDMRVMGGTVIGPLTAASRMHVVIGTFDPIPYNPQTDILPVQTNLTMAGPSSSHFDASASGS